MSGPTLRLVLLLAGLLGACAGTDVGNPPGSGPGGFATVTLRFTGTAPGPQGLTLASGDTVDEAWVVVERIRLRTIEACEGAPEGADDVPGPVAVELIAGTVLPETPVFQVQASQFCRLELDLDALTEGSIAGAPAELVGSSVLIRGARKDGVPYLIRGAIDPRFELDARAMPFSLAEGSRELVVHFDFEAWVAATALDEAEVELDDDGVERILIDRDHNHDRLRELEEAVDDGTELYCEDDDGSKERCASGRPEPEDHDGSPDGGGGGADGEGGSGGTGGNEGTGGSGGG